MRNSCLVVAASLMLFGAVACSGTSVGSGASDGGTDVSSDDASTQADGGGDGGSLPPPSSSDADAPKPRHPSCPGEYTQAGSAGNCSLESTYQCESASGFDAFRVACSCPSAKCDCYTNGKLTKTVTFNGCPACTSPVELAKLCGVAGY